MPEYPETSTNSGVPLSTMRSKEASKVSTSRALPYSFSGVSSRSGRVVFAKRKWVDVPLTFPFGTAVSKITLKAGCGLVPLLGRLGEQLHDDLGDRGRDILQPLAGRHRLSGDMAVHPFHGIGSGERQ